jgi:hypothetical protein
MAHKDQINIGMWGCTRETESSTTFRIANIKYKWYTSDRSSLEFVVNGSLIDIDIWNMSLMAGRDVCLPKINSVIVIYDTPQFVESRVRSVRDIVPDMPIYIISDGTHTDVFEVANTLKCKFFTLDNKECFAIIAEETNSLKQLSSQKFQIPVIELSESQPKSK